MSTAGQRARLESYTHTHTHTEAATRHGSVWRARGEDSAGKQATTNTNLLKGTQKISKTANDQAPMPHVALVACVPPLPLTHHFTAVWQKRVARTTPEIVHFILVTNSCRQLVRPKSHTPALVRRQEGMWGLVL